MQENQYKRLKSIAIVTAIILGIIALAFGVSKYILRATDEDKALSFNEYRIQSSEITLAPENYTGGEVTVTITPAILDEANTGKSGSQQMTIQYQITELNDVTGVVENNWVDYTGPFNVDHNVNINTRLVSASDENFKGPVTDKDVTNIAVAKIGSTTYKTLAEAITAWTNLSSSEKASAKIEMLANTDENVTIPQGESVVIDLSGFNVNGKTASTPVITVNGTLNLIDSGKTSQGATTYGSVTSSDSTAVQVSGTGTLTLGTNESATSGNEEVVNTNGPVINGGTASNGVVIADGGTLNFYDGKITAPSAENHTAIVVNNTPIGEEDIDKLNTPEGYRLSIEIDTVNGREIVTLIKTIIVSFDTNGGTPSTIESIEAATGRAYNIYATWPTDPTKEGYIFVGWKINGTVVTESTEVAETTNHTLTADWTAITYTIDYNANTGTGSINSTTATYDTNTTLPDNTAGITKTGYTLKGWSQNQNANPDANPNPDIIYQPGQTVSNLTTTNNDTVTLYAIWKDETAPTDTLPTGTSTTNTITVNCNQTDSGSGIDNESIQYSIKKDINGDGVVAEDEWTDWQTSPTFEDLKTNTDYQVRTRAKDNDGNGYTESQTGTIKTQQIQNATTTIHKDTANGEIITAQTGMINNDIIVLTVEPSTTGGTTTIKITAPDGTGTTYIAGTDVTLDQDGTYHITIPNTVTGTYTIETKTTDGTNTASNTQNIQIDKTKPTINETVTTGTSSITVEANAADAHSGVSSVTYELLESDGTTVAQDANNQQVASNTTGQFTGLKENHNYKVKITVTDNAGNTETKIVDANTQELIVGTLSFKEASEATNFTPNTSDPNDPEATVSKVWKNDDVEVTIATTGNGTSTTYTYKKVDGSESATQTGTSTIATENGDYIVTVTTTDGSNTKSQSYYFSIDKTAPTVAMSPNSGDIEMAQGASLGTIASALTITEDTNASGIASIRWAISNDNINAPETGWTIETPAQPQETTTTINVSSSKGAGTYYIWAEVTDNAGNVSTTVKTSGAFNVNYVIEFDININQSATEVIDAATIRTTESTVTLANDPTRAGYIFKGWVLDENETDVSNAYSANASYTVTSSTRFYAMWSEVVASTTINETTTYFDSVQEAINFANNNNATVTLLKSTITESVTIAAGQNITLDTNGKTLTSTGTTITNLGTLTVQGNGEIETTSTNSEALSNTGTLTITSGTVTAGGSNAITNASSGTIAISGGTITSTTTAVENNGTINITAGEITGTNIAVENKASGTVSVSGTANISGAKAISISENTTTNAQVTITGGTISGTNYALYNEGNGKFTIGTNDGTVSTTLPEIVGTNYGYYATDTSEGTLEFFDGIFKGETSAIRTGTNSAETVTPEGYKVINGIDGNYKTAYLASQFTVNFDPGQGATVTPTSKTVIYGETYGELPTPVKTGYTFTEWKLNETTITAETTVTTASDHQLTANYTPTTYTITYSNLNGGSYVTGTPKPASYTIEQAVTLPTLEKTGYTFLGWKEVGAEDSTAVTEITTGNTGDKVLEAVFAPGTSGYTLTHYLEKADGTGYDSYSTDFVTATTNDTITASTQAMTIANATYEKATNSAGTQVTSVTVAPDGSTVLNIYYTRNKFQLTVTAGANTTNATGSGTYRWGEEVSISAAYANAEGYEYSNFAWNTTDTSILANASNAETTLTMPAATTEVTATADRSAEEYEITYNLDGGTVATENPASYTIETADFTLNNPSKTGYRFDGWTGSNGNTPQTTVTIEQGSTGDKEYIANWTVNTHTLTYDYGTNGGQVSSSDNTTETTENKDYGASIDLTKTAYKENYVFLGWAETSDATTALPTSTTLTMPDSNKTLYAIYANMNVSENAVEIDLSDTEHLTKTITISGSNYGTVTATSSDSTTAEASVDGNTITITALKTGTATITVTSSATDITGAAISKQITVNVIKTPTAISISPTSTALSTNPGYTTTTLSATITPDGTTTNNDIRWTSSNPEIATVDQSGNVTAVSEGTTTITVATGANYEITATATITVDDTAPDITITRRSYYIFDWTATDQTQITGYYLSETNETPSEWTSTSGQTASGYGIANLYNTKTYYLWVKDCFGNIGTTQISTYQVTKNIGSNTNLTARIEGTSESTGKAINDSAVVLSGTPIYIKATVSEGYALTVKKNNTAIDITEGIITITEDTQLTTEAAERTYNIEYDLDGGTAETNAPTSARYTQSIHIDYPSKIGYTFTGWTSSAADGLGENAQSGTRTSKTSWTGTLTQNTDFKKLSEINNGTVKLTANWTPITYSIRYNLNSGALAEGATNPTTATFDQVVTIENIPTRAGYHFTGWYANTSGNYSLTTSTAKTGTTAENVNTAWSGSRTTNKYFKNLRNYQNQIVRINAEWEQNRYNIEYDLDGGTAGHDAPTSSKYLSDVHIDAPSKIGYTFTGWTSSADDGLGENAESGTRNSMTSWNGTLTENSYFTKLSDENNGTVKLTANWTGNTYTIAYTLNDGTSGTNAPTTGTYGQDVIIDNPTRTGYTFTGWTSTTVGSNAKTGTTANPSTAWTGTSTMNTYFKDLRESGTVTLIASWKENNYEEVTSAGVHVAYYETLEEAFTNIASENTIKPLKDQTDSSTSNPTIVSEKSFILDLDDKEVTLSGGQYITNNGKLTVKNGTLRATSSFVIYGQSNSETILQDATVYQGGAHGISLEDGASLDLSNSNITSTAKGITISNSDAITTVNITGGTITSRNTTAISDEGKGTMVITGTTIAGKDYGIEKNAGTLTIGTNETGTPQVSTTIPSITGDYFGVSVKDDVIFNFYDGMVVGKRRSYTSIEGTVDAVPTGYDVQRTVSENVETAILVPANYAEYNGDRIVNYYETLANALNYAKSGNTIKPLKTSLTETVQPTQTDTTKTVTLEIPSGYTIALSGQFIDNDGTLTVKGSGTLTSTVCAIRNDGTLNVQDGVSINGTGTGTNSTINNFGEFTVNNATINSDAYRAIFNQSTGTLLVKGNNTNITAYDRAIYNENATANSTSTPAVKVEGGAIQSTNNRTIDNNATGMIYLTGGTIKQTKASSAVYNNAAGTIQVSGATIEHTATAGAAIWSPGGGEVIVTSGTVSTTGGVAQGTTSTNTNTVRAIGTAGNFTMSGGTVTSSFAEAVYVTGSNATISGGTIEKGTDVNGDNHTGSAFVYSGTGTATLSGGKIEVTSGGSITVNHENSTGVMTINGTEIKNSGSGNAVYSSATTTSKSTVIISSGNITSTSGYAVKNNSAGIIEINGGNILSTKGSAVASTSTGKIIMTNGTVTSNTKAGFSVQHKSTAEITGGTVTGATYGVWLSDAENTTPTFTLGSSEAPVTSYIPTASTTDEPIIKATNATGKGVQINNGTFNFYDGAVIGGYSNSTGYSITGGTVADTPTGYTVRKTTAGSVETATLSNVYTVTANANGGTIPSTSGWTVASGSETATKSVTYGSTYGTLPTPTRTGYAFEGWNGKNLFNKDATPLNTSTYIKKDGTTVSNGEYSLYQVDIKPNTTYTITNSGGSTAPGYVIYNSSGTKVAGENYANTKVVTFTTPSTASYIKFSVVTQTSSSRYDKDTFQLEENSTATEYESYFVTSSTNVTTAKDHTLTAIWTINNPATPTIRGGTTKIYGASATTLTAATTTTYASGTTLYYSFGYATTDGGTPGNWTTPSTSNTYSVGATAYTGDRYWSCRVYATDGTLTSDTVASDTSADALVRINNAKLTFDATTNGGTLSGSGTLYTRKNATKVYTGIRNSTAGTIPTASKTDSVFLGWYTAATGGSKVLNADGTFTGTAVSNYTSATAWVTTANRTLYARYGNYIEYNTSGAEVAVYTTLADALSSGTSGNTIKPVTTLTDASESDPTIASGKTLTFDLNGYTVTMERTITNNGTLTVSGSGTLTNSTATTITNTGTLTKSGTSTISYTDETSIANVAISNSGIYNQNAGTVSGGCAIRNLDSGKCRIQGGTVTATYVGIMNSSNVTGTETNAAVYVSGSQTTIKSTYGGAVPGANAPASAIYSRKWTDLYKFWNYWNC